MPDLTPEEREAIRQKISTFGEKIVALSKMIGEPTAYDCGDFVVDVRRKDRCPDCGVAQGEHHQEGCATGIAELKARHPLIECSLDVTSNSVIVEAVHSYWVIASGERATREGHEIYTVVEWPGSVLQLFCQFVRAGKTAKQAWGHLDSDLALAEKTYRNDPESYIAGITAHPDMQRMARAYARLHEPRDYGADGAWEFRDGERKWVSGTEQVERAR